MEWRERIIAILLLAHVRIRHDNNERERERNIVVIEVKRIEEEEEEEPYGSWSRGGKVICKMQPNGNYKTVVIELITALLMSRSFASLL